MATGNLPQTKLLIIEQQGEHGLALELREDKCFLLTSATACAEAATLLKAHNFDLILLDLNLPDKNAITLLQKLGAEKSLPVVVFTDPAGSERAHQALKLGAYDCLIRTEETRHLVVHSLRTIIRQLRTETELRRKQQEYRQLSNQFRALFDGIPDNLVLLTPTQDIIWANAAARNQLPNPKSPIRGQKCYQVFHGHQEQCPNCISLRCFESGETISDKVTTADGRIMGLRAFPIKNREGQVSQVIELSSDITDRIKLQSETLHASQLVSLGELAAGVAHEINNPINGVINYADILQKCKDDPQMVGDIAERIRKESDRIADIVGKLLNFANPRNEEMEPTPVDAVLTDALALVGTQLRKSNISVEVDIPDHLPSVRARSRQLEQVFLNLLSNARYALTSKFPHESPDKQLQVQAMLGTGNMIRISVYDNGPGIPEQLRQKILAPFFSTKPAGEGTGLGLSITHQIIQEHGGKLSFESKPGQFTRVSIDLPAA